MYYVDGKKGRVRMNTQDYNLYFNSKSEAEAWADMQGMDKGYQVYHITSEGEKEVDIDKPVRYQRYERGDYEK